MNGRVLRGVIAAFSLAGAGVSAYILSVRWSDGSLLCSTGGCETVQSSPYAEVLGVPVAAIGLVGYLVLAATTIRDGAHWRATCAALALAGFVFSAYLLVLQLTLIDAVCDWCLASDALTSGIAVAAIARLAPAAGRRLRTST
jgi:uncharacterized membrane protein